MKQVIEIKKLSKRYELLEKQKYNTLRDSVIKTFSSPISLFHKKRKESFWALKNISITIKEGEILGIIGKNGAGKSTLLKILTGITPPTTGQAILRGKVASLLEIGTGFHPELTGRENIFLNGTILGMSRSEIKKKFDEIVSFSEIEQFLDMPVKHYSSGMFMRLAFSIAAHLDPEILIVDEVLSVGDISFQKKCLGKMEEIGKQGRTVLFVSHNQSAITTLCTRCILLDKGKIIKTGQPEEVVSTYLKATTDILPEVKLKKSPQSDNSVINITNIRVRGQDNKVLPSFDIRKPIAVDIEYNINQPGIWFSCGVQLKNSSGTVVFTSPEDSSLDHKKASKKSGLYRSTCWIPGNLLTEGFFSVVISAASDDTKLFPLILLPDIVSFNIHDNLEGDSVRGRSTAVIPGVVRPMLQWERSFLDNGKNI